MSKRLLLATMGLLTFGPIAFAISFTGDVDLDFVSETQLLTETDGAWDVFFGGPPVWVNTSGWNIDKSLFAWDPDTDQLHVGVQFYAYAGDADGDGGEGTTGPWLASNHGVDLPNLEGSESICVVFDFDMDGFYDVVAGVGSNGPAYSVSTYLAGEVEYHQAFDVALPGNEGAHLHGEDYELTLNNLSDLDLPEDGTLCFYVDIFAGSQADNGLGEDWLGRREICFTDDGSVEAIQPQGIDLLRAYPNPFNPSTTISIELAETGNVELAVYNLGGQLVSTLVDGMMSAGAHQVHFDASSLPSGLYLARLSTENGVNVSRLILSK